jgi:hypothetical protein
VCCHSRITDAVLYNPTEIVMLMSIDDGIVDADVGQAANKQQDVCLDPL